MAWKYSLANLAAAIGIDPPETSAEFSSISTDTRSMRPGDVFFALKGEQFDGNAFVEAALEKGACAAVTTRQHPEEGPCLVVHDPLDALQRFARWHRGQFNVPLLAITGSCGKTTAKDLIAGLLETKYKTVKTQGNLNNDIGVPLSLLGIDGQTERGVIEMGANHPGEIGSLCALAQPTEAAITLIAPAHLEGFGSIENIAAAKGEIVQGLGPEGVFYVNTDDPRCVRIGEAFEGECVRFGSGGDIRLERRELLPSGETFLDIRPLGPLVLPMPCPAHAGNVLLAAAVGLRHGVEEFEAPLRRVLESAARFRTFRIGPWEVLDDTYNANPASMRAALDALAERPNEGWRIAALGDMLELGEASSELHCELGREAAGRGVSHLFARGAFAGDVAAGALEGGCPHAETIDAHEDIAAAIQALDAQGGVVLVKGSRGMRMEEVIAALRRAYE